MSLELILEKVGRVEALLISENKKCSPTCANFENIKKTIDELSATRKQLVTSFSMEEQTVAVVRRLTDKWRENTEEVSKLKENFQNLETESKHMRKAFDLLYDRLVDVISCPYTAPILEGHKDAHHDKPSGNTPAA